MDKIFKAVKQDGAFFFLLTILDSPIIFQAFVGNQDFFLYVKYFIFATMLNFAVMLAINFSVPKKKPLKKTFQRLLVILFSIMFVSESLFLWKFQREFDVSAVEILIENLFTPEVVIGIIFFTALLIAGADDLKKIFKSMSTKKIRRITYALLTIFLFTIIFSVI